VVPARPAVAGDLPRLERLWESARAEIAAQRGGEALADSLGRADLAGYVAGGREGEERLLVVGTAHAEVVGLASLVAVRDLVRPLGRLEAIYVEPGQRRAGVATAMLALAAERCRRWGMTGLDAPALPGDRPAKSFFESQGLTARLLTMHRRLDPG
jgi:GNAT superfamily N-acetyltransferase